jgi:hypothetical protein
VSAGVLSKNFWFDNITSANEKGKYDLISTVQLQNSVGGPLTKCKCTITRNVLSYIVGQFQRHADIQYALVRKVSLSNEEGDLNGIEILKGSTKNSIRLFFKNTEKLGIWWNAISHA